MLKDETIVCIGFPKWKGEYLKSTVQLMTELAAHNRVLYVDFFYTLTDAWRGIRGQRQDIPLRQILGVDARLSRVELEKGGAIHLLTLPPAFPAHWLDRPQLHNLLSRLNAALALPVIRRAMRRLGFREPVVINAFNPFLGEWLAGKLNEKLLVYYCYDEIKAAPWISKHGPRLEARFIQKTDALILSSDGLKRTKGHLHSRTFVVKNGVDYPLFSREERAPFSCALSPRGQSVVGYLGSVDSRLDYDLLAGVIERLAGHQFVFAGRIVDQDGAALLARFPNVRLLGPRPAGELPAILEQFDLGIIPFKRNELTAAIYPLKINEYLARGKAVVSTGFADLSDFAGLIAVADTTAQFTTAIEQALHKPSAALAVQRRNMARRNSWEARAEEMSEVLEALL